LRRFPLRTLLLMTLALVAFIRLYSLTHPARRQAERSTPTVGDQACRTLEEALEGVVRAPEDPAALARARRQLEACPEPPARACELGRALKSRELLDALCQRCPAQTNPCAAR
jgi:hypothetical protein